MRWTTRLKLLYHSLAAPVRGTTHAERLESFYRKQAEMYDESRADILHGRRELLDAIPVPEGGVWVEFGSGTGFNLELLGERAARLRRIPLVDLTPSLMQVAEARIARLGLTNVTTHLQDVATFTPPEPADVVLFSYSLTMIPDWFAALDNAARILKPGGLIAVVDYYVSRTHPAAGRVRHSWLYRTYAPTLFARNNVRPSPDHIDYLHHRFEPMSFSEHQGRVFGPLLNAGYYRFIGRRR